MVSAQSPSQRTLLAGQPPDEPLVVKGPYNVYLKDQVVTYFLLLGKIRTPPKDESDPDGELFLLTDIQKAINPY